MAELIWAALIGVLKYSLIIIWLPFGLLLKNREYTILKTAVAGPKIAHLAKITLAFEISVLTLTVPGLRAENFKILCAFNQLHHFGPP